MIWRLTLSVIAFALVACADTGGTVGTPAPTGAAATRPATPTPSPTEIRAKIGEPVTYSDGWKVTVTKVEEQPAGRFFSPKPDLRWVAVVIRFDNGTSKAIAPNPFYFKLQDSQGVRRTYEIISERSDTLTSSELAPGGFVSGSLVFSAPIGDAKLLLIYEQIGYKQATFELY